MRVYLAVGHGHRDDGTFDPGAVSADGRWTEQSAGDHIVAEAARLLRKWGKKQGVQVLDESFSRDPNFPGTVRDANRWGADYVVEVHHDWSGAPRGAFGHWYTDAGKRLADDIQDAVMRAGFPLRSSWHKRRTDLYILKHTAAPCVLYEVGRIGDDLLDTPAELRAMGAAIADGIATHLGIPRRSPVFNKKLNAKLDRIVRQLDRDRDGTVGSDAKKAKEAVGAMADTRRNGPFLNDLADRVVARLRE